MGILHRLSSAKLLRTSLALAALLCACSSAYAIELKLTAQSIERTLRQQLFNVPGGRVYLRGDANAACYLYVDQPSVRFSNERIVVHVFTHSRLGAGVLGRCVGLGFNTEADVSVVPDAEGETIGFRDARIDRLTGNKELDLLLIPFLSHRLPQKMRINAADLLRAALARSRESMGYELSLDRLKIHSMQVEKDNLTLDLDGSLRVN